MFNLFVVVFLFYIVIY